MRRDALENAADDTDARELRRELREQKDANRELAEVVVGRNNRIQEFEEVLTFTLARLEKMHMADGIVAERIREVLTK
jgi:hypothetical protein